MGNYVQTTVRDHGTLAKKTISVPDRTNFRQKTVQAPRNLAKETIGVPDRIDQRKAYRSLTWLEDGNLEKIMKIMTEALTPRGLEDGI